MSVRNSVLFRYTSGHISPHLVIRSRGREKERRAMGAHRVYREHKYVFGKQLLILRTRTALTQSALAEQIGVHRRSLQNWETGESYPKAEMLQRLIAVFLDQGIFTPGLESEEAAQLWE